jgi:CheY-like chemotaxis protein
MAILPAVKPAPHRLAVFPADSQPGNSEVSGGLMFLNNSKRSQRAREAPAGRLAGYVPARFGSGKPMFRILMVDDDPSAPDLMRTVMRNLCHAHEMTFMPGGEEALAFLRGLGRRTSYPNLILLDLNMPRMDGLATLAALKADPEFRVIPVIVFSSSDAPDNVRRTYAAYANCYVRKPTDLERSVKFVQAVESFWMDFALSPSADDISLEDMLRIESKGQARPRMSPTLSGPAIASPRAEAMSQAMTADDATGARQTLNPARKSGCEEHDRLLDAFGAAVHEVLRVHEDQFLAIVQGDTESNRFDLLIHMANERKLLRKYDYIRHVQSHGCANNDAPD